MKIGFMHANMYNEPSVLTVGGHQVPPKLYDPEVGQRTFMEGMEHVRFADDVGFDFVSLSEHHRIPLLLTPNVAVLGGALTQVLKNADLYLLGPLVSINNPIRIAEEIAMLDQISGGRLSVALLRGGGEELNVYNNISADQSRAITEEATLLIDRALTATEVFDHKGTFFDIPKVAVWPPVTQSPRPRIFAPGASESSIAFAAKHRYPIAIAFYGRDLTAKLTAMYRGACAKHGWSPQPEDILYRAFCCVGETAQEARALTERFFAPTMVPAEQPTTLGTDADGKTDSGATRGVSGYSVGFMQFCGSHEDVVAQISDFVVATGVGQLDLGMVGGGLRHEEIMTMIKLMGEKVLPQVKALARESQQQAA